MAGKETDVFSQQFYLATTESAAGTLTFTQLTTGAALFERRALLLHRLIYNINPVTLALIVAAADYITAAIVTHNKMAGLDYDDPAVVDLFRIMRQDMGVAASGQITETLFAHDFSQLPGGGLLIPAYPIYLAVLGTSLATPATVRCRGFFTARQLEATEYIELVEAARMVV